MSTDHYIDHETYVNQLNELIERINSHNIDDLKEYIQLYCQPEIIEIKNYYKNHFMNMSNEDPTKRTYCLLMQMLGIGFMVYPNK